MSTLFQTSFYVGNVFNAILYGVEIMLYYSTMRVLLQTKRRRTRSDTFYMFFSSALLCLSAINLAVDTAFGEEIWIKNPNYPGGATAYIDDYSSVWYETMGTAASYSLNLLADGLMIYRCSVVWNKVYIALFPSFLWVASLALAITSLYLSGVPNGNYFAGLASSIVLAYNTTSVSINVIATCLICARLLFYAKRVGEQLGDEAPHVYTNAISIIIESALPYTISSLVFLITYGLQYDLDALFLAFFAMFTVISPQMIIMRVVTGRAWARDTGTVVSTVQFAGARDSSGISDPTGDGIVQDDPFGVSFPDTSKAEHSANDATVVSKQVLIV